MLLRRRREDDLTTSRAGSPRKRRPETRGCGGSPCATVFHLAVYSVDSGCVCGAQPHLMSYFSAPSDGCNGVPHWAARYIKRNPLGRGGFGDSATIRIRDLTSRDSRSLETADRSLGTQRMVLGDYHGCELRGAKADQIAREPSGERAFITPPRGCPASLRGCRGGLAPARRRRGALAPRRRHLGIMAM